MSSNNYPQFAVVDQPFGVPPTILHCPICGCPSLDPDEEGNVHYEACPHLAFIFVGEVCEFETRSEDFSRRLEALDGEEEEIDLENFCEVLGRLGYGRELLAIDITYGGLACGPVWFTDVVGFDFGTLAKEAE